MNLRSAFVSRPWLWIVLLLGTRVLANIVFVCIALQHPVVSVKEARRLRASPRATDVVTSRG